MGNMFELWPLTKCPRCKGVGITCWSAFVTGLANIIGHLIGEPIECPPCKRCNGHGKV